MSKKILKERFDRALLFLENKEELIMGTSEYEKFLDEMINNLKVVKKSLRSRSNKAHRKEADRIQSAINAMKYLSSKNQRILNNSMLNESATKENPLSRSNMKDFIRNLK
jgi:archaellum biogenesis ATPase FlaH